MNKMLFPYITTGYYITLHGLVWYTKWDYGLFVVTITDD